MATGAVVVGMLGAAALSGAMQHSANKKAAKAQQRSLDAAREIAETKPEPTEMKKQAEASRGRAYTAAKGRLAQRSGGGLSSTILTSPLGVAGMQTQGQRKTVLGV
jgi:hypothetical protein